MLSARAAVVVLVVGVAARAVAFAGAVARKVARLAALIAPQIGVHAAAAATNARSRPTTLDSLSAHHFSVHLFDRLFGVVLVLEVDEGKAGRVARQPNLSVLAKLAERFLQVLLRAVDAQVGHVHAEALFVVAAASARSRPVAAGTVPRSRS